VTSGPAAVGFAPYYYSGDERFGQVTVDGAGSVWLVGRGRVSSSAASGFDIGPGSLDVANGGLVISGEATIQPGGPVSVSAGGAEWLVQEDLHVGGGYSYGGPVESKLAVLEGGHVAVEGDVHIESRYNSDAVVEFGLGAAGLGRLEIDGSVRIQTAGGNTALGLLVDDNLNLQVGNLFELITAEGGVLGQFSQEPPQMYAHGMLVDWTVHYDPNSISVEVASATLAGDFNGDGDVDVKDFDVWKRYYGARPIPSHARGDANLDGLVDGSDFLIWQSQMGMSEPAGLSTAATVPEPTTLLLALIAAAPLATLRTKHVTT
jgi:hypothetical protein